MKQSRLIISSSLKNKLQSYGNTVAKEALIQCQDSLSGMISRSAASSASPLPVFTGGEPAEYLPVKNKVHSSSTSCKTQITLANPPNDYNGIPGLQIISSPNTSGAEDAL